MSVIAFAGPPSSPQWAMSRPGRRGCRSSSSRCSSTPGTCCTARRSPRGCATSRSSSGRRWPTSSPTRRSRSRRPTSTGWAAGHPGLLIGAVLAVFIPWNLATIAGYQLGSAIPDPTVLGLDIVFPAAMAGLAVGLMTGRREIVAAGPGRRSASWPRPAGAVGRDRRGRARRAARRDGDARPGARGSGRRGCARARRRAPPDVGRAAGAREARRGDRRG